MSGKPDPKIIDIEAENDVDARNNEAIEFKVLQMKLRDKEELEEKEAIAYTCTMLGRIQSATFNEKQQRLMKLIWLKQVKDGRIYKKMRGLDTWVKFCEACGEKWRTIDDSLQDLSVFADEFLTETVKLGWTPSEVKRLSRAVLADNSELTETVNSDAITIDGKTVPLDADHKDEIMELVADVLDRARKEAKKVGRELAEAEKEHAAEVKDYRKQIKDLKAQVIDPTVPEHFQEIFRGIEGKVTEIVTLASRLDFGKAFSETDNELVAKRNFLVAINVMETQFANVVNALKDAIIER